MRAHYGLHGNAPVYTDRERERERERDVSVSLYMYVYPQAKLKAVLDVFMKLCGKLTGRSLARPSRRTREPHTPKSAYWFKAHVHEVLK